MRSQGSAKAGVVSRMKFKSAVGGAVVLGITLAAGAFPVSTLALGYGAGPLGSTLFFPYLTDDKNKTNIRVTNGGDSAISVRFVRVCGGVANSLGTGNCDSLGLSKHLTPHETLNLNVAGTFATKVTSNCTEGYIIAYREDSFGGMKFKAENVLYGDVSIETEPGKGNRMGTSQAIAIKGITDAQTSGLLEFDDQSLERVSTQLKSTHRAGILATRGTKFFLGSFDVAAGQVNQRTLVRYFVSNEDEEERSGQVSFVCGRWFDSHTIPQLSKDSPGGMGTPFGSVEWESSAQTDAVGNPVPPHGLFGYWMREEGGGKRGLEPMWIDEAGATDSTWTD